MDNFNPFASYNPDSRNEQYLRQIAQLPGAEPPDAPSSRIEWYLDYILKKGPAYMKTGYFYNGQFYSDPEHTVLIDPAPGTIYIDDENKVIYRYNESTSEYESLGGGSASDFPYASLERLRSYLYRITFETYPEPTSLDFLPIGGCSSFVRDGKLYRTFDWDYNENATFQVVCSGFRGTAFFPGLNDASFDKALLGQLPYHVVDGVNDDGIRVATHILYNDWNYSNDGSVPLSRLPYIILTSLHSMADIDSLMSTLANLNTTSGILGTDYLTQYIVTDGTTTYVIEPPESETGSYELINATSNPKLTNFRWVPDPIVNRANLQTRPTGVERWNSIGSNTTLSDLRFTKAYEAPTRLSEFIGIDGTDKDSTDEELEEIYERAHAAYEIRTRDGATWQTMHAVAYSANGIEEFFVQEDFDKNFAVVTKDMLDDAMSRVGGMVVEASTNKTVNGYQVPMLTDEQLLAIYNATVAGKAVTITDATGMMHFSGVTADMVSDEVYITFMYFNTMILEYGEGDVTTYKEIADKTYVDSAIYEVLNTEV